MRKSLKKIGLVLIAILCGAAYVGAGGVSDTGAQATSDGVGNWPNRTITMLVGFAAGGGIDGMARTLAPKMAEYLKTDIVVQNMPGASSGVAATYLINQPADGYTIMGNSVSLVGFAATKAADVTYHDMGMLGLPYSSSLPMIIVPKNSKVTNMKEFIQYVKSEQTTVSHAGVGSVWHIPSVILVELIGAKDNVTYVPYESGTNAALAVAKGEVDWASSGIAESKAYIKDGLVRPIAMLTPDAYDMAGFGNVPAAVNDLPAIAPYLDAIAGWRGMSYKKGTPQPIVDKLIEALKYAVESEEFKKLLASNGITKQVVKYGKDADQAYEMSSRVHSWILYDSGDGPRNPNDMKVPRP